MSEIDGFSYGFDEFSRFVPDRRNPKLQGFGDAIKCFLLNFAADGAERALKSPKSRKSHVLGKRLGNNFPSLSREILENVGSGESRTCQTEELGCSFDGETERVPENSSNFAIFEHGSPELNEFENENENPRLYRTHAENSPIFPAFLVTLALKLITFQLNFTVSFLMFPIWGFHLFCSLIMFPFYTLSRIKAQLVKRIQVSIGNFKFRVQRTVVRLIRALFWAFVVGSVLLGMLILGFVFGGVLVKFMVEEPVMVKESLHFDYTLNNPAAVVPLSSPAATRSLPYNQKFTLAVSLTLPESQYNLKLGVFQVRMEFLSAKGKITASSSYPCMLRFKSKPIRFMETAIRTAALVAGIQSETQTLHIKTNDFKQGLEPTAAVKITLEHRAGATAAAGVPEVYAAAMVLESASSRLKKMVWLWRRTVFIWVSFGLFFVELVVTLLIICGSRGRRQSGKTVVVSGRKRV